MFHMDFSGLYDKYADNVYSYISFRIKDKYLVEDVFQDTFLAVYQKAPELGQIPFIKSWILAIAHNKMVDRLRRTKKEKLSYNSEVEINQAVEHTQPENKLFINELLNRLDETSKTIIYGIYVEQLTYKDMAQILGIPEGTVKSKSYYARAKLRKWLEEDNDGIR